jgi:hypothetical protein
MTLISAAALRLWISTGFDRFRVFGRWWLSEFLALFPERVADWLIERGSMILVLALEEDAVTLQLMSDRRRVIASVRVDRAEYSADTIDAFLRLQRLRRRDVSLGISSPQARSSPQLRALPSKRGARSMRSWCRTSRQRRPSSLTASFTPTSPVGPRTGSSCGNGCPTQHVTEALEALGLEPSEVAFLDRPARGR